MRITSGGLVGIGTDNPTSKLEIKTPSTDTIGTGHIGFAAASTPLWVWRTGTLNSDLNLDRYSGGWSATPALTIKRDTGNIGIGIDSPGVKLDIFQFTNTSTDEATTMLRLTNHVGGIAGGGDITGVNGQRTFIDFAFEDANANFTPQVKIGAQVGQTSGSDAAIQSEGLDHSLFILAKELIVLVVVVSLRNLELTQMAMWESQLIVSHQNYKFMEH